MTRQPSLFRALAQNISWLYAAETLPRLASLIVVPIWSARVAPEDYGRWILALTSAELFLQCGGLGVATYLTKVLYRYHDRRADRYFGMGAMAILGVTALGALGMAAASPWLSRIIVGPDVRRDLFAWLGLYVVLAQLTNLALLYVSTLLRYQAYFGLITVRWIGNAAGLLVGLLVFHQGFYSWVWAWVATEVVLLPVTVYHLRSVAWGWWRPRMLSFMCRFSLPAFATSLVGWGQDRFGRYFLSFAGVNVGLGLYAVAQNFSSYYGAVVRPVKLVVQQAVGHELEADAHSPYYLEFFHGFSCVALGVAFLVAMFLGDLMKLFVSPSYQGAAAALPILVFTLYFQELWTIYQSLMFRHFKVWFHLYGTLVAFPVVLIGTLALVPRIGFLGAALAQLAGALAMTIFGQGYARRVDPRPFRFAEKMIFSAAALGVVVTAHRWAWPLAVRIVASGLVVFPYLLMHWRRRGALFPLTAAALMRPLAGRGAAVAPDSAWELSSGLTAVTNDGET